MIELKEMAIKKTLTKAQKAVLRSQATELGIEFVEKSSCESCFQDLAIQIYNVLQSQTAAETDISPKLKPNIDIIFMGTRVNHATITQELTYKMIQMGLIKYFE